MIDTGSDSAILRATLASSLVGKHVDYSYAGSVHTTFVPRVTNCSHSGWEFYSEEHATFIPISYINSIIYVPR